MEFTYINLIIIITRIYINSFLETYMKNKIILSTLLFSTSAQAGIATTDAINHIGEYQTVCGHVANVIQKKQQVFINFDKNYPDQTFTVYVTNNDYGNLHKYRSKNVCADGVLTKYRNTPEIVNPDGIYLQ